MSSASSSSGSRCHQCRRWPAYRNVLSRCGVCVGVGVGGCGGGVGGFVGGGSGGG